jgi:putative membrane protein
VDLLAYAGLPPLTPSGIFTTWQADALAVPAVAVPAVAYLYAVGRLHGRGVRWPAGRTACFLIGCGWLALATMSSLGVYDTTYFSVHAVQHMLLVFLAPIFLALGAPTTLALRTLPVAGRRRLMAVLHSRFARVVSHPVFAWPIFIATPFVLYLSPLYEATLRHVWLHDLVHVHMVVSGCLLFWPLISLDPVPGRMPHAFRLIVALLILPAHVILGLTIMNYSTPIAWSYFRWLGRPLPDVLADQNMAGGIMWSAGDVVGFILLIAIGVQWMRAEERRAVSEDRRLDRLDAAAARAAAGQVGQSG